MLHLVPPPVGRAAGHISAARLRVRRWVGVIDPDVRRLGAGTGRYLALIMGIVVLVSSIAIPSGLAVRGALEAVTSAVDDGELAGIRMAPVRTTPFVATTPAVQVHVQVPTSLPAGGSRQFRVSISGGTPAGVPGLRDGAGELLRVEVELPRSDVTSGLVEVTPTMATVTRQELVHMEFRVDVDATATCGTDVGHLLVRVVDAGSGDTLGESHVALPPIDCRAPPPPIGGR